MGIHTIENLVGQGIRAKVIHGGYQYSTYTSFAKDAGYPDATHKTGTFGVRTIDARHLVGDFVDVLAKGDHEFMNDTVYVCQTDEGRRFLIGKDGLQVVEKPTTLTGATIDQLMDELKARIEQAVGTPEPVTAEFTPELSPLRTRDNIVERAQWDVEGMIKRGSDYDSVGGGVGNHLYRTMLYNVEFVINKDKRTVVALVRAGMRNHGQVIRHRGVAKCDPTDCFNEHIGKAIALRRAFEIDVPSEYLNAPAPEDFCVGDGIMGKLSKVKGKVKEVNGFYEVKGTYDDGDDLYGPKSHFVVIDDSARY